MELSWHVNWPEVKLILEKRVGVIRFFMQNITVSEIKSWIFYSYGVFSSLTLIHFKLDWKTVMSWWCDIRNISALDSIPCGQMSALNQKLATIWECMLLYLWGWRCQRQVLHNIAQREKERRENLTGKIKNKIK